MHHNSGSFDFLIVQLRKLLPELKKKKGKGSCIEGEIGDIASGMWVRIPP
jgi:hypothetical protein